MMAERVDKQTDQERQVAIPGSQRGTATEAHRAFWEQIRAEILSAVQEYAPTFGTVEGMDGGKVKVHVDGEDDPRTVGMARKKGQRYARGERVKIAKSRSGEEFVDGTFSSKDGRDEAVDNDDLYEDSVDSRTLKTNAVNNDALAPDAVDRTNIKGKAIGKDQIDAGAIDRGHISNNAVGNQQIDANAVDTGNVKNKSITKDKLADNAMPDVSEFVKSSELAPNAKGNDKLAKESDLNSYAKKSELAKNATGSKALATEEFVLSKIKGSKKGSGE